MIQLACTLVSEGSSDAALIPILVWLLGEHEVLPVRRIARYDPAVFRRPQKTLADRLDHAIENFPCVILFVHRDGDTAGLAAREAEIQEALRVSRPAGAGGPPTVSVIPIRMMEAWLLFDEASIRFAAGCPRGRNKLELPALSACERVSDPKALLHRCLLTATGKSGRHLSRFNTGAAVHRVAELIPDYSRLRGLAAFRKLEANLTSALSRFRTR